MLLAELALARCFHRLATNPVRPRRLATTDWYPCEDLDEEIVERERAVFRIFNRNCFVCGNWLFEVVAIKGAGLIVVNVNWVSYIEPPPREGCGPESVLKYLARYLTGGPISDSRT